MKKLTTKQKLINLVSAFKREEVAEYFYTFIALQLYGTADCPDSFVGEVCKMHDEFETRRKQKEAERETNQKTGIEKEVSDCFSEILKNILAIGNSNRLDILNYIKVIISDIMEEEKISLQ